MILENVTIAEKMFQLLVKLLYVRIVKQNPTRISRNQKELPLLETKCDSLEKC